MVLGRELLYNGAFGKGHIVLVGRDDMMGVLLGGLLDHLEEAAFLLFAVDDEGAAENLVAAVFAVDLCKAEHFAVGELAAQLLFHVVEVGNLFGAECQPFLLVIGFQVLDVLDGGRLDGRGEDVLVQTVVKPLQHGVVRCIRTIGREIFLDAFHTLDGHVLGDFHRIGAPWGNHFPAWAYKIAIDVVGRFCCGIAIKPTQFFCLFAAERMVARCGDNALLGSLKKGNSHILLCVYEFLRAKVQKKPRI